MIIVVYLLLAMASIFDSSEIDLAELAPRGVGDLFSEVQVINRAHATSPTFPYVTAVLYLRYHNGSSWSGWTTNNITIDPGDQVQAHWTSSTGWPNTSTTFCNGYGSGFSTGGAVTGADWDLSEPGEGGSGTYTVSCGGWDYPATDADSSQVTVRTIPRGAIMGYKVNALNQAWNVATLAVHGIGYFSANPYNTGWIPAGWYTVSSPTPAGYNVSNSTNPGSATSWVAGASRAVYVPGGGVVNLWFKYTIANPVPIGAHDSVSCTAIAGWTCDASNYNAAIDVHVYADGNFLAAQTANNYRSDLPPVCGGNGYHGYSIPTPESLKDGQPHTIHVYGINTPPGNNVLLNNSPKTLTCSPPPPPTVSLRGRKDGGAWTASNFTVDPVSEAQLTWTSANATDCDATAGPGFATGNAVSGTDTSITEPAALNSSTYTVRCTGPGGSASDSIVITTNIGGVPTLEADPDYVRVGDDTTLTWNTNRNDPATCSLEGPGLTMGTLSGETGSTAAEINGESTFTLTCPGGEAAVTETTVQVLPVVQEI